MAWIQEVSQNADTGTVKEMYDKIAGKRGKISNIMKVHSLRPDDLAAHFNFYQKVMFGASTITTPRRDMLYLYNIGIFSLNDGMILALGLIDIIATTSIKTIGVVFYLDGQEMMVDEEAPFTWTCRQPVWLDYAVVVEAQDGDGNTGIAHIDLGWSLY